MYVQKACLGETPRKAPANPPPPQEIDRGGGYLVGDELQKLEHSNVELYIVGDTKSGDQRYSGLHI